MSTAAVASRPTEALDDHGDPAALASPATRYNAVDRNGPNILIGEYNVANGTSRNPTSNLAEAAFLAGTVRNADVVIGSAYLPALTSVGNWPWSSNLIGFKMFGTMTGDHVVPTKLTGADASVQQVATRTVGGSVYVTVVNRGTTAVPAQVEITGARSVAGTATATTLYGDPAAHNSIYSPATWRQPRPRSRPATRPRITRLTHPTRGASPGHGHGL